MKRILYLALAISFASCADDKKETETTTSYSDTMSSTTTTTATTPEVQPDAVTPVTTYTAAEGDVVYRDGRLMVWKNNDYVVADKDVTLDDGIVVRKNGEVTRDGTTVKLEEGDRVSRTGKFFNKAGEKIEDAWDATKRGVKKAADKVEKAGEKVGDKIHDATH